MTHETYMRRALRLAARGRGTTSPNPMVGAVVVKSGRVIAEGYHKKAGDKHAEIIALDRAGARAQGALLYLTLEPCAHHGRTPPCVDRVIAGGVKQVIIAMRDPNPLTHGRSVRTLKRRGIPVVEGVLEDEARRLNEVFIKYITTGLPFVMVKAGQTLDGKVATRKKSSKWITSDAARLDARRMRGQFDAIMVGVNTIRRDNPRLDAADSARQPVKIVVDSRLSTPHNAKIFTQKRRVIIASVNIALGQQTRNGKLLAKKATVLEVKEKRGHVNLRAMLRKLGKMGITSIMVEGGGMLNGALFDEKLVDKVAFYIAPKIFGGRQAVSTVMGKGIAKAARAARLTDVTVEQIEEDILVTGTVLFK